MSESAYTTYSEDEIAAAVDRLGEASSFAEAERVVATAAPDLQRILAEALAAGGWFEEAHQSKVLAAATTPDEDERLSAVSTLLAEETRLGMMVGVAVGWALREELGRDGGGQPGSDGGDAADGDTADGGDAADGDTAG